MKLARKYVVLLHRRMDARTVLRGCFHNCIIGGFQIIRVYKVYIGFIGNPRNSRPRAEGEANSSPYEES